ncbi:type II toxin-antitoxin system ParD family antitoxin [Rhizobium sp. S96]|uniref:type II toxin-antitoxin system ParD family antitoxin n=1 Tax=Rhizobium sp. S96 TaxID=3055140 RepID=UPI0025AAB79C|nr:type II toxin-antitoxin system ParD family antitoxin [Rhizobium sp. S96]MDM9621986.1 type II toxin-antitoxin system ParD family antitoxin [Rhizobium sp. S96]
MNNRSGPRAYLVSITLHGERHDQCRSGKQLESYIQPLVDTGRYGSKSEVLREGVRLVQDRETRLAALDASIMRGIADADAGRTKPASDVFDRLDAKYRAMADKAEKST